MEFDNMTEPMRGSFTDAIFALLGRFGNALRLQGAPAGSVHAYIFGGCAVHFYAGVRTSNDLDLELQLDSVILSAGALHRAKEAASYVLFANDDGKLLTLEIDRQYNSTLGPLHIDFEQRARLLENRENSALVVHLPSREDLALSKLGRLSPVDIEDIGVLMDDESASWALLDKLTREAQGYYVGPPNLTSNLQFVKMKLLGASK